MTAMEASLEWRLLAACGLSVQLIFGNEQSA